MNLKKSFTIVELLIVLVIIGTISIVLLPSLAKSFISSQFKSSYKKAFSNIANITAMESVTGTLPTSSDNYAIARFFHILNSYLGVSEYAKVPNYSKLTETDSYSETDFYPGVIFKVNYGINNLNSFTAKLGNAPFYEPDNFNGASPWIVTEDKIAYSVIKAGGSGSDCSSKSVIEAQTSAADAFDKSCVIVLVDLNGLNKGPNSMNTEESSGISATQPVGNISSGDRYYIYIAKQGASAGPAQYTITGRIVSGKN